MSIGETIVPSEDANNNKVNYDKLQSMVKPTKVGEYFANIATNKYGANSNPNLDIAAKRIYYGTIFKSVLSDIQAVSDALVIEEGSLTVELAKKKVTTHEQSALVLLNKIKKLMQGEDYYDSDKKVFRPGELLQGALESYPDPQEAIDFTVSQSREAGIDATDIEAIARDICDEITELLWESVQHGREVVAIEDTSFTEEFDDWVKESVDVVLKIREKIEKASAGFAKI